MWGDQQPVVGRAESARFVVGREDERPRLSRLLDGLETGRGRLALVNGEAGIGKSALVEVLARAAQHRGYLVFAGHCYDFLSHSPYAAWGSILQPLNERTRQPLEPIDRMFASPDPKEAIPSQEHLYGAVAQLIENAAEERPLVLVLEDIHWADQASLDLLRYLGRHPVEFPILFVATYRDVEIDRHRYLYRLLPSLIRDGQAERIELRRLNEPAVRELVQRLFQLDVPDEAQLTAFVFRLAEGNPFFTWELLRSLEHDGVLAKRPGGWRLGDLSGVRVPPLVRQIIDLRLTSLDDDTRRALEVAAVVGGQIPFDLWRLTSGLSEQDLANVIADALDAQLLVEIPSHAELRFSHELVRETLYQGLPFPQRRSYHRSIAEILTRDTNSDPSVVASHFLAAADARAAEWLHRAGTHAQSVYAPRDAINHLSDALSHSDELSSAQRREAHAVRARSHMLIGDFDSARFDLESALELAHRDHDDRAQWEALIELGMLWAERDYERTYDYLNTALDLARSTGDTRMLGHSLNRIGNWYLNNDEPSRAESFHLEALESFEHSGDQIGIADTFDLLGLTRYMGGNLSAAASTIRETISLFRTLDRREGLSSSLVDLMLCGGSHETMTVLPTFEAAEDSIACGEEGLAVARDIGWRAGEAFALSQIASPLGMRGDYGRALEIAEQGRLIANEIGHQQWISASHLSLGWLYADLLQLPRARAHYEQSRALAREINSRFWYRSATGMLARVHLLLGDAYRASAILDECLAPNEGMGTIAERSCRLVRAELALAAGDAETSMDIIDRLIATAPRVDRIEVIPALWKARADALLQLGRVDEAVEHLQLARDRADQLGWATTIWHSNVSLARAYLARDDNDVAAEARHDARTAIHRIAEQIPDDALRSSFLREAEAGLPATGGHRPYAGQFHPLDLTPRETEILQLVADGQTDREIAERLSISPRTVMNHIGNIFNKLGVNSRAAATAQAIRKGLI